MAIIGYRGHFVESRERKDASTPLSIEDPKKVKTGKDFRAWVDGQVARDGKVGHSVARDDFPEELVYRAQDSQLTSAYRLVGGKGSAGDDEASFIYLDVGAWIGSADEYWVDHGGYQRDWGIICGPHVLLCTFKTLPSAPALDDAGWKKAVDARHPDKGVLSIKGVLDTLRGHAKLTSKLGEPRVARYLKARPSTLIPKEKDWVVRVIVGDMHVPVVDKPEQATAGIRMKMDWVTFYNQFIDRFIAYQNEKKEELQKFGFNDESLGKRLLLWYELDDGYVKDNLRKPLIPEELTKDPSYKKLREEIDKYGHQYADTGGWVARHMPDVAVDWLLSSTLDGLIDSTPLKIREGDRVARWGRVDLGPLEDLIKNIGATQRDATALSLLKGTVTHIAALDAMTAMKSPDLPKVLGPVLKDIRNWHDTQDVWGVGSGTMTVQDAQRWFDHYRKGLPADKQNGLPAAPPADIFEHAGSDFEEFSKALTGYRKANHAALPLQFHQLGDMIDLWMGLSCHYMPAGANPKDPTGTDTSVAIEANTKLPINVDGHPQDSPSHNGTTMAKHWVETCLTETDQGMAVARALVHLNALDVAPHFLFGNHDNYLGRMSVKIANGATLPQRAPNFPDQGLWMEHGHQWEAANADNAPLLPFTSMLIGTNSPAGELVTQAAFISPAPIRAVGDEMSAALDNISNPNPPSGMTYGYRLKQMAYAADRAAETGAFYAYAMGHTHSPSLCRVRMWPNDAEAERADILARQKTQPTLVWAEYRSGNPNEATSVDLHWRGLVGKQHQSWVALDDPAWPPGHRRRGYWTWTDPYWNQQEEDGVVTLPAVRGGRYVARAYLDVDDKETLAQSPKTFDVVGMSLEPFQPDEDYDAGGGPDVVAIEAPGGKAPAKFFVRFAYPELDTYDPKQFIFLLSSIDDADRSPNALMSNPKKSQVINLGAITDGVKARRWAMTGTFLDFIHDSYKGEKTYWKTFTLALLLAVPSGDGWKQLGKVNFDVVDNWPSYHKQ